MKLTYSLIWTLAAGSLTLCQAALLGDSITIDSTGVGVDQDGKADISVKGSATGTAGSTYRWRLTMETNGVKTVLVNGDRLTFDKDGKALPKYLNTSQPGTGAKAGTDVKFTAELFLFNADLSKDKPLKSSTKTVKADAIDR